jgi:transcriptional regulator with XRE-family HTH domain
MGREKAHDLGMTLPAALRAEIKSRGITQADAADIIGASKANLTRWIKNGQAPRPENYDSLCEFLGVDMDRLGSLIIQTERAKWERGPL